MTIRDLINAALDMQLWPLFACVLGGFLLDWGVITPIRHDYEAWSNRRKRRG